MPKPNKPVRTLHECDDCHKRFLVGAYEMSRAARPRCYGCGSTRLIVVSAAGHERLAMVAKQQVRQADHYDSATGREKKDN